jgi:hypothetical protein
MLVVLHLIAFLGLVSFLVSCWQVWRLWCLPQYFAYKTCVVSAAASIVFAACVFRYAKTKSRQKMLEDGILSINSCAIMWHAVSRAHSRTLAILSEGNDHLISYHQYTRYLSLFAIDLKDHLATEKFDEWTKAASDKECITRVQKEGAKTNAANTEVRRAEKLRLNAPDIHQRKSSDKSRQNKKPDENSPAQTLLGGDFFFAYIVQRFDLSPACLYLDSSDSVIAGHNCTPDKNEALVHLGAMYQTRHLAASKPR